MTFALGSCLGAEWERKPGDHVVMDPVFWPVSGPCCIWLILVECQIHGGSIGFAISVFSPKLRATCITKPKATLSRNTSCSSKALLAAQIFYIVISDAFSMFDLGSTSERTRLSGDNPPTSSNACVLAASCWKHTKKFHNAATKANRGFVTKGSRGVGQKAKRCMSVFCV